MPDYSIEKEIKVEGYQFICGVDEAGRGPLAGPVCAAAVILKEDTEIEGLNDSKKLTERKREQLFDVIREKAVAYSVAFASVEEIEELNILGATFLAMQRAVKGLSVKADFAIIDGNRLPKLDIAARPVIKGDMHSMSVAAASVLAKVTRDRLLLEYDKQYPEYKFSAHKGYGTKVHYEAIREHGITPIHRKSFLKGII